VTKINIQAFFTWNKDRCSPKIDLSDEDLTARAKDGNGFKTVFGSQEFQAGDKYYFELMIN